MYTIHTHIHTYTYYVYVYMMHAKLNVDFPFKRYECKLTQLENLIRARPFHHVDFVCDLLGIISRLSIINPIDNNNLGSAFPPTSGEIPPTSGSSD